jgi:hypothetical protein
LTRWTGAAFLVVVLTSLASGAAIDTATGSGSVTEVLARVPEHSGLVRVGNLAGLVNAVGILILATLLYALLRGWNQVIAFAAALCWTGEAFFYALNQIAANALVHVASDYRAAAGAGGTDAGLYRSIGRFLFIDVYQRGATILMFFYCAGGLLFYWLFFTSRLIPRWLSGYGLIVVLVGVVGASIELLDHRLGLWPYVAIGPFEIVAGLYLLIHRTTIGSHQPVPEFAGV